MKATLLTSALLALCLSASGQGLKEMEGSFLEHLQQRDSILIGDQLKYGFTLSGVEQGTLLGFQDWSNAFGDTLVVAQNWKVDTLKVTKSSKKADSRGSIDIKAYMILAPFEAGTYELPPIAVQRKQPSGALDTLLFKSQEMVVTTIPVDTSAFEIHDIKGQIRYPLTFKEILPYFLGAIVLALLIFGLVRFVRSRKERTMGGIQKEPPYLVALRKLEHFRSEKFWAPEKQKAFYSGITETLREYIAATFDIDAKEMTTAEIFDALKVQDKLSVQLYDEAKKLFEVADFVKFAKHQASQEDNAGALPAAVRFVTSTYQDSLDNQKKEE